jgi:hypothetical protein
VLPLILLLALLRLPGGIGLGLAGLALLVLIWIAISRRQ